MIIHISPSIFLPYAADIELVGITIPELKLSLVGSTDVIGRRPHNNKHYTVACRKVGRGASDGILIETEYQLEAYSVVTVWKVDGVTVQHVVRYVVQDKDFDMVSDKMCLWGAFHESLGGWDSRYPKGIEYGAPVDTQPCMELHPGASQLGRKHKVIKDTLNMDGTITMRFEEFKLPTIERGRVASGAAPRFPAFETAFKV